MIRYTDLFEYFRQCPYLSNLKSIAGDSNIGSSVILPNGSSEVVEHVERVDNLGNYCDDIVPFPSVYQDFQINCYEYYDVKDTNPPQYNSNVLTLEEVQGICEWVEEQDNNNNFPNVGEQIVSIECFPFVPQIQFVDPDTNTVGYFITVRIRYVNKKQRKYIEYGS